MERKGSPPSGCEASQMDIKKLGVWFFTEAMTAVQAAAFAQQVEGWGYGALWVPEARGRNSLVHSAWLLSQTERLVIATGIANIFARDAQATVGARKALDEQSGGRFLLGLGVSHAPLVERLRGHNYNRPLAFMREYLGKMEQAVYDAVPPRQQGELVLAALGPKMLELSRDMTDGAHPYNVTPEHTAEARSILGPNKRLYVEQKVMLESDPAVARGAARELLRMYIGLPNYRNNWLRLGFTDEEIDSSADRFLDAMVAWGDEAAIAARIQAHLDAGADHVCLQPVNAKDPGQPETNVLAAMARYFEL
jgi:probable F420-dependent oxidoreductase